MSFGNCTLFRLRPVAVLLAFPASIAFGQDVQLPEMTVTATKTAQLIEDVPSSVSVINREQIEKSGATTVDQLLQTVPGVYSARMHVAAPNRIAQTYTRGMSGNGRTLVLIDGVPMNVQFDGQVDWSQLTVRDVERVEVVRGAGSGLYGNNAMGGVINIMTRSPKPGMEATATGEIGSNNTRTVAASVRGRTGVVGYSFSGSELKSDGYDMWTADQKTAAGANRHKLIAMGTEKTNFSGKLSFDISDKHAIDFNAAFLDDKSTGFYDIPEYVPTVREQWLTSARYRYFGEVAETSVVMYGRFGKQYAHNTAPPYATVTSQAEYDDQTVGINLQTTMPVGKIQQLSFGADYLDGSIDVVDDRFTATPTRVVNRKGYVTRTGVFIQDEIKPSDRWVLNAVARLDHWETHGSQTDTLAGQPTGTYPERSGSVFSPKFSALYRLLPQTNLRASVGKAFKLPELWEMYSSSKRGATTYWGNPNLKPETVVAYELGIDQYFGKRGYVKGTLYRNDAKNFVYSVRRNATNQDKMNVEEVVTKGVEIEAKYRMTDNVSLTGSYTYNDSTIRNSVLDPALIGMQLVYVPKHRGSLRADFTLPYGVQAFAAMNYVGKRYADDKNASDYEKYTIYDLGISKRFNKTFDGRITVHNLTDKVYEGIGYMSPGRLVFATVNASF